MRPRLARCVPCRRPVDERGPADSERRARVALSFLAQPGDLVLGAALRTIPAEDMFSAVTGTDVDGQPALTGMALDPPLARTVARWRDRLPEVPRAARLAPSAGP